MIDVVIQVRNEERGEMEYWLIAPPENKLLGVMRDDGMERLNEVGQELVLKRMLGHFYGCVFRDIVFARIEDGIKHLKSVE